MATASPSSSMASVKLPNPSSIKTLNPTRSLSFSSMINNNKKKKKPTATIRSSPVTSPSPSLLRRRLSSGDTLYGIFLLSSSPTLAEIAGLAGYDYVVVDMEHGAGDHWQALPVLRLPDSSPTAAKKALDLGPDALMFPNISSPAEAEAAVASCRYPPRGLRGAAFPVVHASGYGTDDGYLARCEDDLMIIQQGRRMHRADRHGRGRRLRPHGPTGPQRQHGLPVGPGEQEGEGADEGGGLG